MAFDEVTEVLGSLVIEGFVSDGEYFEVNSELDWEPVEFTEDRYKVVPGSGSGVPVASRVLNLSFLRTLVVTPYRRLLQ